MQNNKLLLKTNNLNLQNDLSKKINLPNLNKDSFKISTKNKSILNAIEIIPNKLETIHLKYNISDLNLNTNEFISCTTKDNLIKVAVIERHKNTGNIGLGVLKGISINSGAIATAIAHDSHNLIVYGTNYFDMIYAANELKKINGGIIVVKEGKTLASISLKIGGIITSRSSKEVISDLNNLHSSLKAISSKIDFNPFLILSFLSLPVIPEIKITDKGLFDVTNFKFIPICE